MEVSIHDFRRPRRLTEEVQTPLSHWLQSTSTLLAEKWKEKLSFPVTLTRREPEVLRPADATVLCQGAIGFRFELNAQPARGTDNRSGQPAHGPIESLLVVRRPLALALMLGLLGQSVEVLPDDREPTLVESSLGEMLMHDFAAASTEALSMPHAVCHMKQVELRPERVRMFPDDENVIDACIEVSGPFGVELCHWLIPQEHVKSLFAGMANRVPSEGRDVSRPKLEALVRETHVEVSVQLGQVTLHLSELANLRSGDLVILDQRIIEPLVASVDRQVAFRGWPGRVGTHVAYQIESLVET